MSFNVGRGTRLRGTIGLALASALVLVLLVSGQSFAQSPYAPNVMAHTTTKVPLFSGGATVDDRETTGITVTVSGLTNVTASIVVTTETLNAPSTNVPVASSSGNVFYFDVNITLPVGMSAPSGATATIILSNPMITSGYTFEYWAGSAWLPATFVAVSGTTIEGDVPVSSLTGTNLAAIQGPTISTSSASPRSLGSNNGTSTSNAGSLLPTMSVELLAIVAAALVIVISAIVLVLALMRNRAVAKYQNQG
jgi:hypothetical protein